jgi:hypothetical protein
LIDSSPFQHGQASASLWLRDLDSLNGRILPGTSGASYPFWSPDSHRLGFFAAGKLKKIDVSGGPALTLCDAPQARGGSWNQDDLIVYGLYEGGLFRVPAAGGTPVALTEPDVTAAALASNSSMRGGLTARRIRDARNDGRGSGDARHD